MKHLRVGLLAAVLLVAGCGGDDGPGTVRLYDRAPVPAVPDRTSPVTDPPTDGVYWAALVAAVSDDLTFELTQVLFAQTCIDTLGADACTDGFAVIADPNVQLTSSATALSSVSVAAANRQNYAVDGAELVALINGATPGSPAPEGFDFTDFPFLVTVRSGAIVEARQIWMP